MQISKFESDDFILRPLRPHQVALVRDLSGAQAAGKSIQLFAPTASGKTLAVNSFAFEQCLSKGKRVLWIGHAWNVVGHALACMFRRYGDSLPDSHIAHLASSRNSDNELVTSFCDPLWRVPNAKLAYTTFQTMHALLVRSHERPEKYRSLLNFKPDLIVIDESHIGADGLFDTELRKLLKGPWKKACVVGMSATPRKRLGFNIVVGDFSVDDLVRQNVIAKPNHVAVRLKTPSKVRLDSNNNVSSYAAIAACESRNREIARHYYENKLVYGKTVIFCANKQHANNLGSLLRGHNPLVIHGDVDDAHSLLRLFATSKDHNLALLVRMGTTGLDIPELKTVMLAKPTTSDVEIVQMAGRAFRLAPGKRECFIVDFFENISDAGVAAKLYHFREAFDLPNATGATNELEANAATTRAGGSANPPRTPLTRHTFVNEPATVHLQYDSASPWQAALDGLHINPNQTFGIEFELTSDVTEWYNEVEWEKAAKALSAALRKELGPERAYREPKRFNVHGIKYDKWQVVYDGSCGWEIVSPILKGKKGFEEVVRALGAVNKDPTLKTFKFKVDASTGCHVHFGYNYRQAKRFQNLVQFVRRFEGALFTLCPASRFQDKDNFDAGFHMPNEYCTPLLGSVSNDDVEELGDAESIRAMFCNHDMRYHTVNLSLFDSNPQRLEVRMHSGTTEPEKILLWVSLWQNIFNCLSNFPLDVTGFSSDAEAPEISGKPDGDIVHVAAKYLALSNVNHRALLTRLHERRKEVMSNAAWKKVLGTRKQRSVLAAWQARFDELMRQA